MEAALVPSLRAVDTGTSDDIKRINSIVRQGNKAEDKEDSFGVTDINAPNEQGRNGIIESEPFPEGGLGAWLYKPSHRLMTQPTNGARVSRLLIALPTLFF